MTVPVLATSCTEPFEKTYSPLSAMPSALASVSSVAAKLTSPRWFRSYVAVEKTRRDECPAAWHGVPRTCYCERGALFREQEDGKGGANRFGCWGEVAAENDVVSAIHDGP